MIKKILITIIASYLLIGCTVASNHRDSPNKTDKNINKSESPSEIFTYPLDTSNRQQPLLEIVAAGKFLKKEGCLVFQMQDRVVTPIFPETLTEYKDGDNEIVVNGEKLKIGENLEISIFQGYKSITNKFVKQGPDYCLENELLYVRPSLYPK